ncbi:MAG: UDP-N-acetylglucosamine diphosphorylase [bacterium]
MLKPENFFDLSKCPCLELFKNIQYVWEVLPKIEGYIKSHLTPANKGKLIGNPYIGENVFIDEETIVEHGAMIKGPAIIGKGCEIRNGAYIRENVILGDGAILGNSCEIKNSILFNEANVPHFAYVGDSVLGFRAHLGAGVKISNVKLISDPIIVDIEGQKYNTGLIKFGAIIGDGCDIGCNAVLNPGTIIGPNTIVYTGISWRGYCKPNSIVKLRQTQIIVERKV